MNEAPSAAGILLPNLDVPSARRLVDQAMVARRYVRWEPALPKGYPAATGEWVGLWMTPLDAIEGVLAVPADISMVFQIATWLSENSPHALLSAWRCFRGGEPVVKYFLEGKPQWKDGRDKDLEVRWSVPSEPPVELRLPNRLPLPASVRETSLLLAEVIRPYPTGQPLGPGDQQVAYLRANSRLR